MTRWLLVYEDPHAADLAPLADLLPVPALRLGAGSLAWRWQRATGLPLLRVEARAPALAAWREAPEARVPAEADEVLVVNAAALPGPWLEQVRGAARPTLFTAAGRIAAARLPARALGPCLGRGERFEEALLGLRLDGRPVEAPWLAWPWDFVARNAAAIAEDLRGRDDGADPAAFPQAALLAPERVHVAEDVRLEPFAVLDARGGPILLEPGVVVGPHTVVVGPCVVGAGTQLLGGSIARASLGPDCRVAGEVEESIFQGRANKRHHGFVGHSVVGEWVNLGALTTTSDLKNNYGPVRVWAGGRERDSGSSKVGAFVGAHVKTGIGSLLATGASLGTGSNLFGGGRFAPKRLPPFAWWDGARAVEHRFEAFLATARTVMGRRGCELGAADEAALRAAFEAGAPERAAAGIAPAGAAAGRSG